jgi:hypothetical protein
VHKRLYFRALVAQLYRTMTRHFFSHIGLVLAGLLAARVPSFADMTGTALAKLEVLESNVAYLRVSYVAAGLPDEIGAAISALTATNKIAGTVLDLRFADGDDPAAAAATANLFATKKLPLAILVNSGTRGAAATLASALREARAGLVFGSSPATVEPDISVEETQADEKKFFENPYATLATNEVAALSGTNNLPSFVDHISEADLVREKQKDWNLIKEPVPREDLIFRKSDDSSGDKDSTSASVAKPPEPVIRDPVLARAVDLIKGLAVVREAHF